MQVAQRAADFLDTAAGPTLFPLRLPPVHAHGKELPPKPHGPLQLVAKSHCLCGHSGFGRVVALNVMDVLHRGSLAGAAFHTPKQRVAVDTALAPTDHTVALQLGVRVGAQSELICRGLAPASVALD